MWTWKPPADAGAAAARSGVTNAAAIRLCRTRREITAGSFRSFAEDARAVQAVYLALTGPASPHTTPASTPCAARRLDDDERSPRPAGVKPFSQAACRRCNTRIVRAVPRSEPDRRSRRTAYIYFAML